MTIAKFYLSAITSTVNYETAQPNDTEVEWQRKPCKPNVFTNETKCSSKKKMENYSTKILTKWTGSNTSKGKRSVS